MVSTRSFTAASYPATYRQREVRVIVDAIKAHQSILINGPAGAGKSHLVRFLASNPRFQEHYFGKDAENFSFFFLDCNAMDDQDKQSFYRVLIAELRQQAELEIDYKLQDMTNAELLIAIRECLDRLYRERLTAVFIFDRLEKYRESRQLGRILDNLRHLRDYFSRRVSYILATRGDIDIASISDEFQDLLYDPATLYLKPLVRSDAEIVIDQYEREQSITFNAPHRSKLIGYSGAYPRLLRTACALAHEGKVDLETDDHNAIRQLLDDRRIQSTCRQIWDGLSGADRIALRLVTTGTSAPRDNSPLLWYGLLTADQDGRSHIFCPVFKAFVQENAELGPSLELKPPNEVQRGTEVIRLTSREYKFLAYLLEAPNQACTYDDIIYAVWNTYDGVTNQNVAQLASIVGRKINLPGHNFIENEYGVGYRLNLGHGTAGRLR